MKKRIYIIMLLSLFAFAGNAYAVMDAMGILQSTLKYYQDYQNFKEQAAKKITDTTKTLRQGFQIDANCFANPKDCYTNISQIKHANEKAIEGIRSFVPDKDLMKEKPQDLVEAIVSGGTFKKGQGKDIDRRAEFAAKNNAVVTDILATLFAKGIVTRQSILYENQEQYNREFKENNMDEILFAQNTLTLTSSKRIAQILELRTFMHNAQAIKELTQYNREAEEK